MFADLHMYADFEKPFLAQTQTFYQQEGVRLIQEVYIPPSCFFSLQSCSLYVVIMCILCSIWCDLISVGSSLLSGACGEEAQGGA